MEKFGSYSTKDVTILLKDITGQVEPQSTEEREKLIQQGTHYCEMLPIEYKPSQKYIEAFYTSMDKYKEKIAESVRILAQKIYDRYGENAVIVSLARAGTPVGVLLKRYIRSKYNKEVAHYTISIIRGKGIDKNAMDYILSKHEATNIVFVDGWTGKGAIKRQLEEAMVDYPDVNPGVAVLADPAGKAYLYGFREDILIPSSLLNSTVSGLLSRTFLRSDIIGPNDFHGAVYYKELENEDISNWYIDEIEKYFNLDDVSDDVLNETTELTDNAQNEVQKIAEEFGIDDINLIKPSIGECTRVLLRRVPDRILVHCLDDPNLEHIYRLAKEKNVPVQLYPLCNYYACGIIMQMGDV